MPLVLLWQTPIFSLPSAYQPSRSAHSYLRPAAALRELKGSTVVEVQHPLTVRWEPIAMVSNLSTGVETRRIKTNAEDGCTGPMARNGSATRFVIWMVNKVYQRDGDLPVETRQVGGVPGPQPRSGPPSTTMQGGHPSPSPARKRKEGSKSSTSGAKDKQPLHILYWNAEGIFHKKTPLKAGLENEKISIACIQRTHLNPENRFSIRGYQAFRMDRMGHKGGVIILIKNEITAKVFQIKTERSKGTANVQAEIHGVDITINQTCIKIFNIYCPDNKDLSLYNFDITQKNCIFLGDLNSHSTCWGYEANNYNARGDEIEDWQSETNMVLINDPDDPPTFYSRRCLASASGNLAGKIQRNVTTQLGGSDHRPVLLTMDLEWKQKDEKTFPRWNHKKANWNIFSQLTNRHSKMIKTNHYNIKQQVKNLNDCILKAAKETIPRGARKKYRPYWTAELQELEDTVETARVEVEQHPTVQNNVHLKASEAKCKKAYIQAARTSWRQKTNELNMDRDGNKMWNLIRAMNDESKQSAPIVIEKDEQMYTGWRAAKCFIDDYQETSILKIPHSRSVDRYGKGIR